MSRHVDTWLPPHLEALVRAVHRRGRAGLEELLTASGNSQPVTPVMLRQRLAALEHLDWLCRLRVLGSRRIYWGATEEAVPHLLAPARLPRRPTDWIAADEDAPIPAPTTPQPARASAPVSPPWRGAPGALYVPPPAAPLREGALGHLRCASRGLRC